MPSRRDSPLQMNWLIDGILEVSGQRIPAMGGRVPHLAILKALEAGEDEGRSLVEIYREDVLMHPTRTVRLLGRKCEAQIMETLLGYEVKASYKRIQCPDLVTARYLRLFTEIGCRSIKLPYDPTRTADIIREMEEALERLKKGIEHLFAGSRPLQLYVTRRVWNHLRRELVEK